MPAIESIGMFRTAAAADAAPAAATVAPGDSFTVRNFPAESAGYITALMHEAATVAGSVVRVRSPLLYDDVRGIEFLPGESPTQFQFPRYVGQRVRPQDTLTFEMLVKAIETDAAVANFYYDQLPGGAARLASWGDIAGNIKAIKGLQVVAAAASAIGGWSDTVITSTEDLLHANTDHAVLGYITDVAVCAIGIKGQDTANLRIAGPGVTRTVDTSDYFIMKSQELGKPYIPVFNSANKNNTFLSVYHSAAASGATPTLILAELSQPFAG